MAKVERIERIIRFPRPLYARLKKAAKRNERSANAEVIVALNEHLNAEEKR